MSFTDEYSTDSSIPPEQSNEGWLGALGPKMSSLERFLTRMMSGPAPMSLRTSGTTKVSGSSRVPSNDTYTKKSRPENSKRNRMRRHKVGSATSRKYELGLEGRLTRHSGRCEPTKLTPERAALYMHSKARRRLAAASMGPSN